MATILITNDDGIAAPGLRALVERLEGLGKLYVVAPVEEQSGKAQSLTLRRPIGVEPRGERQWAVDGTPTDGIIIALNKLLPERPDLVVSGINAGANMGENIFYSGTVGAAMEATVNHLPSLAISVAYRAKGAEYDFAPAARLARRLAEITLREGLPEGVLLNVNVPQAWNGSVRFTRQSKKITRNVLKEVADPQGRTRYWLHEQIVRDGVEPDTDYAAIFDGAASITPVELDRTHEVSLNHLSHWAQRLAENL
jgi:5'-nucleotidase